MEPLGRVLEGLLPAPGYRERLAAWRVLSDWEEIVGEELASRTRPAAFARGVLTLAVSDPVWASALRFEAPRILSLLNRRAGRELFREIRFVVEVFPRPRRKKRLPELSPEEEARLEESVRVIEDPELREVFRAWRRVLLQAGKRN
ncbi:DUF721 domain-containing protein [Thermosulfurimonas sp. F29]|uniref:DUF721 domain-containing protein n=1 Tax=Thermosulfurimonas sp. F29 TaxID=2867247 RepID=UPI001C82FFD3|nr:DUF721 domain-containing protein [Thermosulfurimonas sp. F29]MBX6422411.1 DUF721 domain-containing protein [Thermosulfurimonas sp. F29]